MLLIADSGSTKTSWCLSFKTEKIFFETEGYNPYYVNSHYIFSSLKSGLPSSVLRDRIKKVLFYGAGCSQAKKHVVENALSGLFTEATITVDSDLLGAARSLLGERHGFAAILGTGTNTCIYNGREITENVDSLGYILGDEGSGSYLGKKFIRDYIRGRLPEAIHDKFVKQFHLSKTEVLDIIYSKPLPNRFCASFSNFLGDCADSEYTRSLVRNSFTEFFENLVSCYPDFRSYSFNSCGSVGFYFKEILEQVAEDFGMKTGTIIKEPIGLLAGYHAGK